MVRATAALLLLLRDAEAAYIAVVGPTGDDVIVTDLTPVRLQLDDDESYGLLYEDGELLTELPHKNWVALRRRVPGARRGLRARPRGRLGTPRVGRGPRALVLRRARLRRPRRGLRRRAGGGAPLAWCAGSASARGCAGVRARASRARAHGRALKDFLKIC